MFRVSNEEYVKMYGPIKGTKIRLGDTDLFIEVEEDTGFYGDSFVAGFGGISRSRISADQGAVDMAVLNGVLFDGKRILKADIGIVNGKIFKIGRAGDPYIQDNVEIIIGASTTIVDAKGMIVTPGGIDCFSSFLSHTATDEYLRSGVTTVATCGIYNEPYGVLDQPYGASIKNVKNSLQYLDGLPINVVLTAVSIPDIPPSYAGALFSNLNWAGGRYDYNAVSSASSKGYPLFIFPESTDSTTANARILSEIDRNKKSCMILDASGSGFTNANNFDFCGRSNVLPISFAEKLLPLKNHKANMKNIEKQKKWLYTTKEKLNFMESQIDRTALEYSCAEDILHDMGVIPIISSGERSPSRVRDFVKKVWQLAHVMKFIRGRLPEDPSTNDNFRAMRYISKYTINPAIALGLDQALGTLDAGKQADLAIWEPAFFGHTAKMVIVNGIIARENLYSSTTSLHSEAFDRVNKTSFRGRGVFFVNAHNGPKDSTSEFYNGIMKFSADSNISKSDMVKNEKLGKLETDSGTSEVRFDGELLTHEYVGLNEILPLHTMYDLRI